MTVEQTLFIVACKYGVIEAYGAYIDEDEANKVCEELNDEDHDYEDYVDDDSAWQVVRTVMRTYEA